jgi:hypothetical protein
MQKGSCMWAVLTLIHVIFASYVFAGIVVFVLALSTGNWFLIGLAVLAYALDLAGLRYANTKDW